jgi:ATP citrate (pro-S)-lyase
MTRNPHSSGSKILFIGGGIANFTNVAATFKGIIRALHEFKDKLIAVNGKIFVRRAGPNYQEGLRLMREVGKTLGLEIKVFGPETHITHIVPLALKGKVEEIASPIELVVNREVVDAGEFQEPATGEARAERLEFFKSSKENEHPWYMPFTKNTRSFVYGLQNRAVQGMLDFDYMCNRETPSVAAMIYPFGGSHVQKFYWGTKETLLPVFTSIAEAIEKFPEVDTVVNFASCRSVYPSTMEMMKYKQIRSISLIAEGVPERRAKEILSKAKENNVLIIGPATVGGIKPGCFKIGNTGGMMDNIVDSKLYRAGSVAYVSKSGGMSNELNNIISRVTNGVYEGVAIGGDRYPGSTFIDHMLRFEADPEVKILVLLGEVGGVEEYEIVKAVKDGRIKKPIVAWCIGTCAGMFSTEVNVPE